MTSDEPVTAWIEGLRNGEDSAARKIWEHFVKRLADATRRKIHPRTRRVYNEDDAAQSAFQSLYAGVAAGRFPNLNDREGLWRLLLVITSRKIAHRRRHDQQQCRDIRRTIDDSVFASADDGHVGSLLSREPTPEFEAEFVDMCRFLFEQLDDARLEEIARLKIEGYTDAEISGRVCCSRQSVQRKVERIRRLWNRSKFSESGEECDAD